MSDDSGRTMMDGRGRCGAGRLAALALAALALVLAACSGAADDEATGSGSAAPRASGRAPTAPAESASPGATTTPPRPTASAAAAGSATAIELREVGGGLAAPIGLVNAADGSGRLFAVEQGGTVRVITIDEASGEASVGEAPFLDVSDRISAGGERGLLGLAFHPAFEENRRLFAHYTDLNGNTVIAEYTATAESDAVDPESERVLVRVEQPFPNHNGGMIGFGPDGQLYIALGDGGGANDPLGTGQDPADLLGAILRIDVDTPPQGDLPYAISEGNPFAADGGAPEVWDYGLRNPWRFSFDRETGDLYIGDVGQGAWEEIDVHADGDEPGLNFGWNVTEGGHCFQADACDDAGLTPPVAEYPLAEGHCAVIGGYVYRGEAFPTLNGIYLFADHCSGVVWGIPAGEAPAEPRVLLESGFRISSFGEDEAGELYAVDLASGALYAVATP